MDNTKEKTAGIFERNPSIEEICLAVAIRNGLKVKFNLNESGALLKHLQNPFPMAVAFVGQINEEIDGDIKELVKRLRKNPDIKIVNLTGHSLGVEALEIFDRNKIDVVAIEKFIGSTS